MGPHSAASARGHRALTAPMPAATRLADWASIQPNCQRSSAVKTFLAREPNRGTAPNPFPPAKLGIFLDEFQKVILKPLEVDT